MAKVTKRDRHMRLKAMDGACRKGDPVGLECTQQQGHAGRCTAVHDGQGFEFAIPAPRAVAPLDGTPRMWSPKEKA